MALIGGIITVTYNGNRILAAGEWEYNLGLDMAEGVVGQDRVHGYIEKPQIPFIRGRITKDAKTKVTELAGLRDATVVLELAGGGGGCSLKDAWWAAEGTVNTATGEVEAMFQGMSAEEL